MSRRLSFALCIALFAACVACGRSNIDFDVPEGGLTDVTEEGDAIPQPDAPSCNASNCPMGCCDATGACQNGASPTACGTGGEACQNCTAEGFQFCYEAKQACGNAVTGVCGPSNCKGCCVGGVCLAGSDPTECGVGGAACNDCQAQGQTCNGGQCAAVTKCAPGTCSGCCQGSTCVAGNANTACGTQGLSCSDCTQNNMVCDQFGSCVPGQQCGPSNCPNGCCQGNVCVGGTSSMACGGGGKQCTNCAAIGENCQNQVCTGTVTCNAQNCASGCCEGSVCVVGTASNACGFGGQACQNCSQFGEVCNGQTCQTQTQCNAQTCGFGCCQGNTCFAGNSSTACGFGGQACQNCQSFGDVCQGQVCTFSGTCNAQTCPGGCCLGNTCVPGTIDSQCGFGGQACQNCQQFGEVCQGQVCSANTGCNPNNCFGCCQGNVCFPGTTGNACGFGGGQCSNCQAFGETCQNQQCQSACGPNNCQGCCDSNQICQPGFLDNECGGFGGACQNCTALNPPSTCNGSVFPPQCASQQMTCPSPYMGCSAPPIVTPTQQPVCSAADLQNAAAACAGGAQSTACQNFFNFEFSQNPACGQCLQPFDYDFADQEGVFDCVAPFVPAGCNQTDACDFDCTTQSCGSCSDQASYDTCRTNVASGQCAKYQMGASSCVTSGYSGGGSFCNPSGYSNYGTWLQGVGGHYCGGGAIDAGSPG